MWDWLRRKMKGSSSPTPAVELKARQVKLPVLDNYPIQHLVINVVGMNQMGEKGAAGFLRLEGDVLTITVWDNSLLTPLQEQVGFAVTYEMKKGMAREIGANLAEELMRRPS